MSDSSWLASVVIAILAAPPPLLADDTLFSRSNVFCAETIGKVGHAGGTLVLANGELVFLARGRGAPTEARAPSIPINHALVVDSRQFVKDGAMLQVRAEPEKRIEKDGWYLTGDYSTKPPRVILTKEPTKFSHWAFVETDKTPSCGDPEEGIDRYIKNLNDEGEDAWLVMEDKCVKYKGGGEVRTPTLSFEKRMLYFVANPFAGK